MRIKSSSFFLIFLLLLMLFVIGISLSFRTFEAKLLPLLTSSSVLVLAIVELSKELLSKYKTQTTIDGKADKKAGDELHRFGSALAWVLGFLLGIYLLGFSVAILLFAFSYMKLHGRGWLISISFAVIITALMYGIFELGMQAPLYPGIIFSH